jgi:hypothetical protein
MRLVASMLATAPAHMLATLPGRTVLQMAAETTWG